jgi:hypothetical protein
MAGDTETLRRRVALLRELAKAGCLGPERMVRILDDIERDLDGIEQRLEGIFDSLKSAAAATRLQGPVLMWTRLGRPPAPTLDDGR